MAEARDLPSTWPGLPDLPLTPYRDEFERALRASPVLLEAEPGAGKSTLAPLWALAQVPPGQSVWLVQPRVLAARSVARRLAQILGESAGQIVGYQVPYDHRAGAETRLLVMTPGVLLQRLLADPALEGVAIVMLDEVHERSVNQDTAWAFLQEAQILRDELQLVLMSATPDPGLQSAVTNRLFASGRCFPVSVDYLPTQSRAGRSEFLEQHLLRALATISDWNSRTALIFLPGWRAIEQAAGALQRAYPEHPVYRLHSRVADQEQQQALDPASGPRLILATNIAETSLTIADVTLVVDSGLVRRPDFEQKTGVSRLKTRYISRASAEQRRGRAGRVAPGYCIRLWSQELALAPAEQPEMRTTDYLPLVLRLAHWGSPVQDLPWLEQPNPQACASALQQLKYWHLVDDEGLITAKGQQVSGLGTHPRLAALLQSQGDAIAAPLLDMALALHFDWECTSDDNWLQTAAIEARGNNQWRQQRRRWLRVLSAREVADSQLDPQSLAWAFRDRIGFRQASGRFRLNTGISIAPDTGLSGDWALFVRIAPQGKGHRGSGYALSLDAASQRALSQPETELIYASGRWQRRVQWLMGGRVIAEDRQALLADQIVGELLALLVTRGLHHWPWNKAAHQLLSRARLAARYNLSEFPDLSDSALEASLDRWLGPFLHQESRLETLPWRAGVEYLLGYELVEKLNRWLPERIELPSGRLTALEYPTEGLPELSAKLQEFFGCQQLALAEQRVAVRIHLASPNGSPLAITSDLASFWRQAYPEVRKQMRGRYPKHPWPEDPLAHPATQLTKKRLTQKGGGEA